MPKKNKKTAHQKYFELMQNPEAKRKDIEKKRKIKKEKDAKEKEKKSLNRLNLRDQKKPEKMGNPAIVGTYKDARENAMINRDVPYMNKGGEVKGTGAAIRGKGFKGVF
tara:strand:- start:1497 stop:1823 length:327 start_codon:yes stop_codon:yes gene_type:complete